MPDIPAAPLGRRDALTGRQRSVLDYMRGNGCVLTTEGWLHFTRSRGMTNRGLSQVLRALVDKGLVASEPPPAPSPRHSLTEEGRRA